MLTIYLKNGNYIDIPNFEKVSYISKGTPTEKTAQEFGQFSFGEVSTYNFLGSINISVKGQEILYIQLNKD